jgi:2-keto-4-pentenoate hydratase
MSRSDTGTLAAAAAAMLLDARRARRRIARLPEACRPSDAAAGYAVQAQLAAALGGIGGWKIGAGGPDETPLFAPIIAREIHSGGAVLSRADFPDTIIEAEIAFRLRRDLPPGAVAHQAGEVAAAVEMLPALEIYGSRFIDPTVASEAENIADCLANVGLVVGSAAATAPSGERAWDIDLTIDGRSHSVRAARHPVGDPLRLVVWLANTLAARGEMLRAGQVVTTGALLLAPIGHAVDATWRGLGSVSVRFD